MRLALGLLALLVALVLLGPSIADAVDVLMAATLFGF